MKKQIGIFVGIVAVLFFALAFAGKALAMGEPPGPSREISLTLKNNRFEPSAIKAEAGEKLVLVVANKDAAAEEFESHDLSREKVVPPGGSVRIKVGPLKAGTYNFVGEYHEATAKGTLTVTEAAPAK